ncbi:MAG: S1C family serine protease [Planctomycetota bacterium]|jgi:serine protease Do
MPGSSRVAGLVLAVGAAGLPAAAGRADTLTLKSGAVLQGTILKRNEQRVWLDVGPEVVAFPVEEIVRIDANGDEAAAETEQESLFHTATALPQLAPEEQARRVGPAVIKIATPGAIGSGVLINADGHAITNAHVVQGETNLRATVWLPLPDGTLQRMVLEDIEISAVNNHIDLALLKIPPPEDVEFVFAPLAAADDLEIGQVAFAIGNPLGLERTLSQGVISTTRRSFDGLTYVQTDTAVNPGNSGGPLFNTRGEIIGITNMKIPFGEGLNFAIPARYVKDFIRNREAFAYNKVNPNSGHHYHEPPPRKRFVVAPQLNDGEAATARAK